MYQQFNISMNLWQTISMEALKPNCGGRMRILATIHNPDAVT